MQKNNDDILHLLANPFIIKKSIPQFNSIDDQLFLLIQKMTSI